MERPQNWADSVLVDRLRRGDSTALADVYDAHAGLVHGLALRVLRDRRAAEEVTRHVFVSVWEAPEQVTESGATLRSVLTAMAHRRAVEIVRRTGDADTTASDDAAGPGPSAAMNATRSGAAAVVRRLEAERVRDAVGRLPAAQRRALELAYFRGRTYRQVAEEMGVPEDTAKSRLRLGLQAIAETLRGEMSQQWA
jgi:RNA polymerase sigma factor (sigma-70 family)